MGLYMELETHKKKEGKREWIPVFAGMTDRKDNGKKDSGRNDRKQTARIFPEGATVRMIPPSYDRIVHIKQKSAGFLQKRSYFRLFNARNQGNIDMGGKIIVREEL